jgi:hypothetical protein
MFECKIRLRHVIHTFYKLQIGQGKPTMAANYRFVCQTQNVVNQNFLGYYTDNAYGMLF